MVRILRALDPFTYKTLQRGNPPAQTFGQKYSGDANVEGIAALARARMAGKAAYERSSWAKTKVPRA